MTREEIIKEAQEQVNYRTPLHTEDFIHGYVVGAEPREKRITELEMTVGTLRNFSNEQATCIERLEKENEQWKQRNETLKDALEHARKVYGDDLEKSYKEIAELNKKLSKAEADYDKMFWNKNEIISKAKELLNEFMRISKASDEDFEHDYSELIAEAVQFLKEK